MNAHPTIAILCSRPLTGIGLKTILEKVIPMAAVELYNDFDSYAGAEPTRFFHTFADAADFDAHSNLFRSLNHRTILLTEGEERTDAMLSLDINQSEEGLVHDILQMHRGAHRNDHDTHEQMPPKAALTPREEEVLRLIAQGFINKEIADRLHIGLTTVISHRRNLSEKLGIRSVAGLAIYAARAGYTDHQSR